MQSGQQSLMDQAVDHHRAGQYGEAEALYLGVSYLTGDRSSVAVALGGLYLQSAQYDKAVELLEDFVERDPKSADGWMFLGHTRMKLGRAGQAAYAYLSALALRRNDAGIEELFWAAVGCAGGIEIVGADPTLAAAEPSFRDLYAAAIGGPAVTHPIFTQYVPWTGYIPPGFHATPYGSLMRLNFYGPALQATSLEVTRDSPQGLPPRPDESYFEWIDLLESIAAAKKSFTMVELGAGFGRWMIAAASAIRLHRHDMPFHLIGVEAENSHFEMMRQHFLDNHIDPDDHKLIKAAVSEKNGEVHFINGHAEDWWGQAIVTRGSKFRDFPDAKTAAVPCLSIETILDDVELVDLIDMDIQGAEADAVRGSKEALCAKVKRVHIGTHGASIERELVRLFSGMGWVCCNNFPCGQTVQTHYGPISFVDGVQTWINPALRDR